MATSPRTSSQKPFIPPDSVFESYTQGRPPPATTTTPSPTQSFVVMENPWDPIIKLLNAERCEAFVEMLSKNLSLSCDSVLQEGKGSTAFLVHQGEKQAPMMLQVIHTEKLKGDALNFPFCLNHKHVGIDWHLFLSDTSPLTQPTHAVAWNTKQKGFELLTQAEIVKLCKSTKTEFQYYLHATLSSYQDGSTPLYNHPLISHKTYTDIKEFIPSSLSFPFVLGAHLKDLTIEKFLGKGSFSQVWAATYTDQKGGEQKVALRITKTDAMKSLDQKTKFFQISKKRFGGEFGAFLPESPYSVRSFYAIVFDQQKESYRILSRTEITSIHNNLSSIGENVLTLYGILGEYCEGAETLDQKLKKKPSYSLEEIGKAAYQLLKCLEELKTRQMMHRDLKPANILVLENGDLKVFDFGFSKAFVMDTADTMLGSPVYMAPETLDGQTYDSSADLYSIFCILYEMALNKLPSGQVSSVAQLKQANATYAGPDKDLNLQSLDTSFRNLLNRLGHKIPKERWSVERLLNEDEFLKTYAPMLPPDPIQTSVPKLEPPPPANSTSSTTSPTPSPKNDIPSKIPKDDPEKAPPLSGRVIKLAFIAGIVIFVYYIARYYLIQLTRPRFPREKLP
ncbi:MAG: serine/threonine-protein kinase [Chlamydiia bacterium]|nr:serine/threonine-protein kinase [Chlamydiia bacterium]